MPVTSVSCQQMGPNALWLVEALLRGDADRARDADPRPGLRHRDDLDLPGEGVRRPGLGDRPLGRGIPQPGADPRSCGAGPGVPDPRRSAPAPLRRRVLRRDRQHRCLPVLRHGRSLSRVLPVPAGCQLCGYVRAEFAEHGRYDDADLSTGWKDWLRFEQASEPHLERSGKAAAARKEAAAKSIAMLQADQGRYLGFSRVVATAPIEQSECSSRVHRSGAR